MPEHTPKPPEGFFDQFFPGAIKKDIPPGYMNTRQIADAFGVSLAAAGSKMRREVDAGRAGRIYVRELAGGRTMEVPYFGPVIRKEPGH